MIEAQLRRTVLMTRLVWLAQTLAVPAYGVIGYTLTRAQTPQAFPSPLPEVFAAVAVLFAIGALLLPRYFPTVGMVKEIFARDLSAEGLAAALSPNRIDSSLIDSLRELSEDDRKFVLAGRLFSLTNIIRLALAESVALFGFVLTMATRTFEPVLYFGMPALLVLILCFPRLEPFMARIEAIRAE